MDHLALPTNPVSEPIHIPFLVTRGYDGLDFKSYPQRHGWTVRRGPGAYSITYHGEHIDDKKHGGFLQTWLYFGLLSEFMGKPIDIWTFRKVDAQGENVLSSAPLKEMIPSWSEEITRQDWSMYEDKLVPWKDRLYDLLLETRDIVLRVMHAQKDSESMLSRICMSIAVLGENLLHALKDIFIKKGLESPIRQNWRVINFADCGLPILQQMKRRGWCPNQMAAIDTQGVKSIAALWYYANMDPPRGDASHEHCTSETCALLTVSKASYMSTHHEIDCNCAMIGPNMDTLWAIITQGGLPLVCLIPDATSGKLNLQLTSWEPGKQFVAISHVWADGLGNTTGNELPKCSLLHIQELVNRLAPLNPMLDLPFWIDTLCVPRKPLSLRQKALERLGDPYRHADHVLVLDSYLRKIKTRTLPPMEVFSHVTICGWTQRLWTFQEGRLAQSLWFQFEDQSVRLFDCVDQWRETFFRIPSLISHDMHLAMIGNYTSSRIYPDKWFDDRLVEIPNVRYALRMRSTSNKFDEFLCVGSVMGLDMRQIASVAEEERAAKFWSLVPKVPVGFAMSRASRKVTKKGCRWAPESLMGDLDVKAWEGPSDLTAKMDAMPSSAGLIVKLPVLVFKMVEGSQSGESKSNLFQLFNSETSAGYESLNIRDDRGNWIACRLLQNWHQESLPIDASELPAILLEQSTRVPQIQASHSSYQPQWSLDGVLIISKKDVTGKEILDARAHRHVLVQRVSEEDEKYLDNIWKCYEVLKTTHTGLMAKIRGKTEDLQPEDLRFVEDRIRESGTLRIGQDILSYHGRGSFNSEEAVFNECRRVLQQFCLLDPWVLVREAEQSITWCID